MLAAQTTLRSNRRLLNVAFFALVSLSVALTVTPAIAQETDTVTLVTHFNKAAKAYNDQQWAEAKNEFRICIAERPQSVEFYEGLFNTCMKSGEWDQVAYALEKIFALDPSQKTTYSYEYGQALYHLNRYDAAIPYLKSALATADDRVPGGYIPKVRNLPVLAPLLARSGSGGTICGIGPPASPFAYLTAATHSESICLAEYKGYDTSGHIDWHHPPQAHYHITEILKGPPYAGALPAKYEFHDLVDTNMPKHWKFSNELMPEKDSKWILFIESAMPKHGMYELYQGSYGRQPASEENLNQLYSLLDRYNLRNRK